MLVEIALSMLVRSHSANTRGDLEASDHLWRRVRLLYQARMLDPFQPGGGRNKSFRFVGKISFLFFLLALLHDGNLYPACSCQICFFHESLVSIMK